ncbi:MAG: nucleotidyltransferase domain-containing protein, partial [Candidatus Jordarchaeales archaeon]
MSGGSEERDRLREEIIEELKKKMHEVRAIIDPSGEKVKLIGVVGRFARGDWHPGSDIDVILVCEGVSGPHWKRLD